MPEKQQRSRKRRPWTLQRFWSEWGIVLIIVVVVVGVMVVIRLGGKSEPRLRNSSPYRVYFTQGDAGTKAPDGIEAEIVKDVSGAKQYVEVASPAMDLEKLTSELISLKAKGIEVRVVEEASQQDDAGVQATTKKLQDAGIQVVLRDAEGHLGEAFVVVDGQVAWAGSCQLTRTALTVDASYILRWQLPAVAINFHAKFDDMFTNKAFGKGTTVKTPAVHIAFLNGEEPGSIDMYMTPEDDPIGAILQSMDRVQVQMVVLSERFEDQRLLERFIGESATASVTSAAVMDRSYYASPAVEALKKTHAVVVAYTNNGKLGENAILLDHDYVFIVSQPLVQQGFDQNDGFVIIIRDKALRTAFENEFKRLLDVSAPDLPQTPAATPPTTP